MKYFEKQDIMYYGTFLLILVVGVLLHIQGVLFTTADDLSISQLKYADHIKIAEGQGRYGFYLFGWFQTVPYLIDSFIYFKTIQILSIGSVAAAISIFAAILFRNKHFGFGLAILTLALWQNSEGHNFLTAYPFFVALQIVLFMLSLIFFLIYIRKSNNNYLFASLFFWFLVAFGAIDFWIIYLPLYFFILYYESTNLNFKKRILFALINIKWFVLIGFFLVVLFFWYKSFTGATYGGHITRFDMMRIFETWMTYAFGLLPGIQFYYDLGNYDIRYLIKSITFNMLFVSSLFAYVMLVMRNNLAGIFTGKKYYMLVVVGIYGIFAPVFLISLTLKYQEWALERGVNDYLYSAFSYFAIAYILLILFSLVAKKKYIYIFGVMIVALLSLSVQVHNGLVGEKQAKASEKLLMLNALLASDFIKAKHQENILAPSLWDDSVAVREEKLNYWDAYKNVWTDYAKIKYSKEVNIRESGNYKEKIDFIRSEKSLDSKLYYIKDNYIEAIFTFKSACHSYSPCYVLNHSSMDGLKNILTNTFINENQYANVEKLANPSGAYRNIHYFSLKNIKEDDLIGMFNYNPLLNKKPMVEFDSNFYRMETDGNNSWVWAKGESTITINYLDDHDVTLEMDIEPAVKSEFEIQINGNAVKLYLEDGKVNNFALKAFLKKGENHIRFIPLAKAIRLSEVDPRFFAFRLFAIKIKPLQN